MWRGLFRGQTSLLRHVLKYAVLLVVEQDDSIFCGYDKVDVAIVVVVACGAGKTMDCGIEASIFGHVFELAPTQIVVKRHSPLRSAGGKKNVDQTIVVEVEEARARTKGGEVES